MSIGQDLYELQNKSDVCQDCAWLDRCICDEDPVEEKQDDSSCTCYHLEHCVC